MEPVPFPAGWTSARDMRDRTWKTVRKKVKKEMDYTCQYCHRRTKSFLSISIHHVLLVSKYPEYENEKYNMIVLCADHHNKLHRKDPHRSHIQAHVYRVAIRRLCASKGLEVPSRFDENEFLRLLTIGTIKEEE